MTPQEARELLHDWQEGGMVDWDDSRRALETIAADQIEYQEQYRLPGGEWEGGARWYPTKLAADGTAFCGWFDHAKPPEFRIVARSVSTPWEVAE